MDEPRFVMLTGAYGQRPTAVRLLNTLAGNTEAGSAPPLHSFVIQCFPYAALRIDAGQSMQLFAWTPGHHIAKLLPFLPDLRCIVLVHARRPEAFREVKSLLESLRADSVPYSMLAYPAASVDSWSEHDLRLALKLDPHDTLLLNDIDDRDSAISALWRLTAKD